MIRKGHGILVRDGSSIFKLSTLCGGMQAFDQKRHKHVDLRYLLASRDVWKIKQHARAHTGCTLKTFNLSSSTCARHADH